MSDWRNDFECRDRCKEKCNTCHPCNHELWEKITTEERIEILDNWMAFKENKFREEMKCNCGCPVYHWRQAMLPKER